MLIRAVVACTFASLPLLAKPTPEQPFGFASGALALCSSAHLGVESPPAPPPSLDPLVQRLKSRLDEWVRTNGVPGATLSLCWPDGRGVDVASGLARRDPAQIMTPQHRMMSGSIGKTWCAVVALQLVDEGILELDTPISKWLGDRPWFNRLPNAQAITLRMLLKHTSGIEEHVMTRDFIAALRADPARNWAPEELIQFALDDPALFPAGEGWSYADTNFILAAIVIEAATGRDYNDLTIERLIKPLGLDATSPVTSPDLPGIASGYTGPDDPFSPSTEVAADGKFIFNPQFEFTGGGMLTSSHDLALWACEIFAGQAVPLDLRDDMLDGVEAATGPGDRYGLGIQMLSSQRGKANGHSGFFPGYVSLMLYFPNLGLAAALQVNTSDFTKTRGMRTLLYDAADIGASVNEPAPSQP